ncbi:MAG: phytanoyl-CoA dioxygenase family protein [Chloroflexi bacterium]|nr:phytanoyl-CoA dioxygenase family protein [Chloroflexota bacterium]
MELPDLSQEYPLSAENVAAYRANGHILLRDVASPEEMAAYGPAIVEAAIRYNTEHRALEERDTYKKAFLQIMNLWACDDADAVRRFVLARRFAKIAADLMGVERVRLYHDQALFKEAGGGYTPWHQDQHYWPLDTDQTITMWMPLVDVTPEMGVLHFASGSHTSGSLGEFPISDESQDVFRRFIAERGFRLSQSQPMAAGDATFHSGWVLHAAAPNTTDTIRKAMTMIYYPDGARVVNPVGEGRQKDLARWLPGCKPGDLAASELNPVV